MRAKTVLSKAIIVCEHCHSSFRRDNTKRHNIACKVRIYSEKQDSVSREELEHTDNNGSTRCMLNLKMALMESENEVRFLRTQLGRTESDNLVLETEKAELSSEKVCLATDKARLALQLCKEKDDKIALREQLFQTRELLAQQELEFTKQLATSTSPAIHNHHYHQYAVHMTPWCIDPTDPSYERFLAKDVSEMQAAMASGNGRGSQGMDLGFVERQNIFSNIVKKRLDDVNPRYVVPDISRHKGMFLMPDGTVRVDPGLSMMIQHQYMIGLRTANNTSDWWFLSPADRKQFQRMIASSAGNGAIRLKQLPS